MSPLCRNKNLTQLQRRSISLMSVALVLTVCTNFSGPHIANPLVNLFPGLSRYTNLNHPSGLQASLISAISILPVLFGVWVAARYLKSEPDEFIRTLVVRALLWGFAVTMIGDAVVGVLTTLYGGALPLSLVNADIFFASSMIAFRILQWSYR